MIAAAACNRPGTGAGRIVHSSSIEAQVARGEKTPGAAFVLSFAACLSPAIASACQITVSGSQPGFTPSAAVDCINIENANVAGDINNRGSVLQNGITIRNSVVNRTVSNIGPFGGGSVETIVGGISVDSKSFIGGGAFPGIEVTAVPSFAGGINTDATIPNGIYVFDVQTFAGGVHNGGNASGFSISGIAHFSGGVSNSGQINGIQLFELPDFAGGVFNSGTIRATGFNGSAINFFDGSLTGGITKGTGKISATDRGSVGILFGDLICRCDPHLKFAGGIINSGSIEGDVAGIALAGPAAFSGAIVNSGTISGSMGLLLFDGGLGGISVVNSGTITGTGGTAIEFGAPGTLTLTSTSVINGRVMGQGGTLQFGGSSAGVFDVSALGTSALYPLGPQYEDFEALNKIDSSTWTLTGTNALVLPVDVKDGILAGRRLHAIRACDMVDNGATLGGSGTIGGLVVDSGGTRAGLVMPFSTLNVAGAATFAAGSTWPSTSIPPGKPTSSSQRARPRSRAERSWSPVRGGLLPRPVHPHNRGGRRLGNVLLAERGSLATLAFLTPGLSYDANDVYLGSPPNRFATVGRHRTRSPRRALSAQPVGSSLYNALIGQTKAGALTAFNALSGEIHASAVGAAFERRGCRAKRCSTGCRELRGPTPSGAQTVKTLTSRHMLRCFRPGGRRSTPGAASAATATPRRCTTTRRLHPRRRRDPVGPLSPRRRRRLHQRELEAPARGSSGKCPPPISASTAATAATPAISRRRLLRQRPYGLNREVSFPGLDNAVGSGYGGDTCRGLWGSRLAHASGRRRSRRRGSSRSLAWQASIFVPRASSRTRAPPPSPAHRSAPATASRRRPPGRDYDVRNSAADPPA